MHRLRFRQVHLDFHTSPAIEGVGKGFDRRQWQAALKKGHVDSITCFALCHHGWSYHETAVGRRHPHLDFDLLRAQVDACQEIGVKVPVYLSAGVNNRLSHEHPEWREVGADGRYNGWARDVTQAGFHKLCFNSPYTEHLCELVREVAALFPDANGIFLDIISQGQCCCRWCLEAMERNGLRAEVEADRRTCAGLALDRYYTLSTAAARAGRKDMPVFHNSGHVARGRRDLLKHFSHLELESLPTGGWGYDHFPMSATYSRHLGLDFLGMTGKFHNSWGEFGGYKHPGALRYECAAMLAYGSKCSVGDQLHPSGRMDEGTYALIGEAYAEVQAKEKWCEDAQGLADVGLLSSEAVHGDRTGEALADTGATRILLEGHVLFDILDRDCDFEPYRVLVLPDDVPVDDELFKKLKWFLKQGGRLLLTGDSGFQDGTGPFLFDVGAEIGGHSGFCPDYILPAEGLRPSFCPSPFVAGRKSRRLKVSFGESLGDVYDPYFNRDFRHFCSHQHAPPRPGPSGFHCGALKGQVMYLAHPVFTMYRLDGAVAMKEYVLRCLDRLLGPGRRLRANLPSTARVTLTEQTKHRRYVLHLLYAPTALRGGSGPNPGSGRDYGPVEVIEDLPPLHGVEVELKLPREVRKATLEPQGWELALDRKGKTVRLRVDNFSCHQMVALAWA